MPEFPGFPSNSFAWHFEEVGPALAGLVARDRLGNPRAGIFPSRPDLIRGRSDWRLDVSAFVAVRRAGRAVLIGGTDEDGQVSIPAAPSANARLDVVWTRPANLGDGEPVDTVRVTSGTPAAVPIKPAIPAGAIELGTVRVSATSTSTATSTVTNTFPFSVAAGGILPVRVENDLSGWDPVDGSRAYVIATGREFVRRRGAWEKRPIKCGGYISIKPDTGGIAKRAPVKFPVGLFSSPPSMQVTANSGHQNVMNTSAASVTKDGGDIVLVRSDTTSTGIWWEATEW